MSSVVGTPLTPYFTITPSDPPPSSATRKGGSCAPQNRVRMSTHLASASPSVAAIGECTAPLPRPGLFQCRCCSVTRLGISLMQMLHAYDQNSSTTTLPRSCSIVSGDPLRHSMMPSSSGAVSPSSSLSLLDGK